MNAFHRRRSARVLMAGVTALALSGCVNALERLNNVGSAPVLAPIENPTTKANYRPVTLPMPAPQPSRARQTNSLWRPGARTFFRDQRAARVGDLLTVTINIADKANLNNTTQRKRTNTEKANIGALLGYEASLDRLLPEAVSAASLLDLKSDTTNKGKGSVTREETIKITAAVMVTQVLPNGNLVIYGRQEVRVNFEVRELKITGIVRPEDISASNIISHDKIAEARISYGGRGQLTDVQQPRYGTQVLDILMPF